MGAPCVTYMSDSSIDGTVGPAVLEYELLLGSTVWVATVMKSMLALFTAELGRGCCWPAVLTAYECDLQHVVSANAYLCGGDPSVFCNASLLRWAHMSRAYGPSGHSRTSD